MIIKETISGPRDRKIVLNEISTVGQGIVAGPNEYVLIVDETINVWKEELVAHNDYVLIVNEGIDTLEGVFENTAEHILVVNEGSVINDSMVTKKPTDYVLIINEMAGISDVIKFRKRKPFKPPEIGDINYRQPSPNVRPHIVESFIYPDIENEI